MTCETHTRAARLTRVVVERFKADGPGWQTRMDNVLKKAAGYSPHSNSRYSEDSFAHSGH